MGNGVVIEGLENWERWAKGVVNSLDNKITSEVDKSGSNIERNAKLNVPVDTGDLRKSITKNMKRSFFTPTAEIFTDLHYGADVELGTSKQRAQPYLFPALNQEIDELEKNIRRLTGEELD